MLKSEISFFILIQNMKLVIRAWAVSLKYKSSATFAVLTMATVSHNSIIWAILSAVVITLTALEEIKSILEIERFIIDVKWTPIIIITFYEVRICLTGYKDPEKNKPMDVPYKQSTLL